MRKIIFIVITGILFSLSLYAQEANKVFYYYQGEKIFLQPRADKVFLKFTSNIKKEQVQSLISENTSVRSSLGRSLDDDFYNSVVLEVKENSQISSVIESYKTSDEIVSITPILQYNDALQGLTDEFAVKLKRTTSCEQLQELARKNHCKVGRENEFVKNQFMIHVSKVSDLDALQMSNLFYETGLFEFSEPNFIVLNAFHSNDTLFNQQYYLKNTGQSYGKAGVDIKAERAWEITQGSPNIKVAVIDQGVDLTHLDLQVNLLPGYDASGNNSGGAPVWNGDNHGIACAGIIGAVQNNREGISGVSPYCKIIPIHSSDAFGNINTDWAANSIQWAWQNGADVISNSWGGGSPYTPIDNAINDAVIQGRGRKGCVVVFSSGNARPYQNVFYPANHANVIAVGAVDRSGNIWDYSSRGNALDVVAPSGDTDLNGDIVTTDRVGSNGYETGNYTSRFGGTSAACPQVAGVAALILSVRPNLTQAQVRNAIESTCKKLSGYLYSTAKPNGNWNNEVGYGLVDAHAALSLVAPKVSGSTLVLNAGSAYTLNLNGNSGGAVTWTWSDNLQKLSSNNTSITVKPASATSSGIGWIQATVGGISSSRCEVWVGKPAISGITGERRVPNTGYTSFWAEYDYKAAIPPNGFQWVLNPIGFNSVYGPTSACLGVSFSDTGYYQLLVRATNVNGTGEYFGSGVSVYDPSYYSNSSSSSSLYRAYPNPVSDELTVSLNTGISSVPAQSAGGNKTAGNKAYTVYLYNANGASVRQSVSQGDQTQLNVSGLPGGIYYLMIDTGDGSRPEVHKIIVKH